MEGKDASVLKLANNNKIKKLVEGEVENGKLTSDP